MGKFGKRKQRFMCKAFFLHVSYCISKYPPPFFYKRTFLRNCGHYQWCLEIYDLNFSKDFFQCYFNHVNKCR